MATVIGLVAGLAVSALIVVSHDLMTVRGLVSPRVLFGSAVAALLTTTAFGRGRTHFAKRALYDFPLLALDIVMIIAAAALVGLMTRSSFSFDGWAWGWLAVVRMSARPEPPAQLSEGHGVTARNSLPHPGTDCQHRHLAFCSSRRGSCGCCIGRCPDSHCRSVLARSDRPISLNRGSPSTKMGSGLTSA